MSTFSASRRALVASVATLALGVAPAVAPAAAVVVDRPEQRAENFLADEVRNKRIPNAFGRGADWGLTVDTIYLLAATGGKPRLLGRMGRVLADNASKYTTSIFGESVYRSAGATAKVAIAAAVLDRPVRNFGGVNYRKRLASFVRASGRLSDRNSDGSDYSSSLTQSLGVIAFSRSGTAPQRVVNLLLDQQCRAGYFTQGITRGKTCSQAGGTPSIDSTAYAVQAMLAAKEQGDARVPARRIDRAVRWLVRVQAHNGAFSSDRTITTRNANSTGLAAVALADAGRDRAVRKARSFMRTLQVTAANAGRARSVIGAVAYDRAALRDARRNGVSNRDQFRRATAQGAFAFAPKPLRTLSAR
jgi:hypothetical protein